MTFSQDLVGVQGVEGVSGTQALGRERRGFYPLPSPLPRAAAQREQRGAAGLCLLPGCGQLPAQGKAESSFCPSTPPGWPSSLSSLSPPSQRCRVIAGR